MNKIRSLSICFCAFNEQENIGRCIDDALKECGDFPGLEILVIDNASTDRTPEVVEEYARKDGRIRLIRHPENCFYAGSHRTALSRAAGDVIAILDGDFQHTCRDVPAALKAMGDQRWDVVCGWKKIRHDGLVRKFFSIGLRLTSQVLLRHELHDINCGFRVFSSKAARSIQIREEINSAGPEIVCECQRLGLRFGEVPVEHFSRSGGSGMHDSMMPLLKNTMRFLKYILRLRSRYGRETPVESRRA